MPQALQIAEISNRMSGIATWLETSAARHLQSHRHLDKDGAEAAYWHAGYHQALADALRILNASEQQPGNADKSNRFPQGGLGAENSLSV